MFHHLGTDNLTAVKALSLLIKQKRLAKTMPIRCIVRGANSAILAEYDSLAENL